MTKDPETPAASPAALVTGTIALLVSLGFAITLSIQHFGGIKLPGCGADSACSTVVNSAWGKVPGIGWPTSHVGVAWFAGLLIAWLVSRGAVGSPLRWLVRLGAVGSVVLLIVMAQLGAWCPYCLGVHGGNLMFVIVIETMGRKSLMPARGVVAAAVPFVLCSAVLAVAEVQTRGAVEEEQEQQREQTVGDIINQQGKARSDGEPFTGRYLHGPEEAAIRIVIISDYQCPDCKKIEMQLRQILEERDDVSVSAKHFPFCEDCNDRVPRTMHGNACWAARAAETAGRLGGAEAFWKMHFWLFDRDGVFRTQSDLNEGIAAAGLSGQEAEFGRLMRSPEIDALIKEDVNEAVALGLHFTPMVFVNGVELKGVFAKDALLRTVEEVAATNPEPRSAAFDQPPMALGKYIEDWQQGTYVLLNDSQEWILGNADAPVQLVMWADVSSEFTGRAMQRIRRALSSRPYVSLRFRHYPLAEECNARLGAQKRTIMPHGCLASRMVEAAGRVGGNDVFWKSFDWVNENREQLVSPDIATRLVDHLAIDSSRFLQEMASGEVDAAIDEDVRAVFRFPARGFPALVINGRFVPRWELNGESVLGEILDAAHEEVKQ